MLLQVMGTTGQEVCGACMSPMAFSHVQQLGQLLCGSKQSATKRL